MSQYWTVNSEHTYESFCKHARKMFDEHKYTTYQWRHGQDRSLDQNALFQVWARQYAAHFGRKPEKEVTEAEHETVKRHFKKMFYLEVQAEWMILEVTDLRTGQISKTWRSSSKYGRGEMFEFLTFVQALAAQNGCILEARGEFNKLNREKNQ